MDWLQQKLEHNGKVLQFRFPDGVYLSIRHLTCKEHRLFSNLYNAPATVLGEVDDLIAKTVVLNPFFDDDWLVDKKAGICNTIANLVMYLGGDHADDVDDNYLSGLMSASQIESQSLMSSMYGRICSVFHGYKFSDLDELSFPEIVKIYSAAEKTMIDMGVIKDFSKLAKAADSQPTTPDRAVPPMQGPAHEEEFKMPSLAEMQKQGPMIISEDEIRRSEAEFGGEENLAVIRDAVAEQEKERRRLKKSADSANVTYDPDEAKKAAKQYNDSISAATMRKQAGAKVKKNRKRSR